MNEHIILGKLTIIPNGKPVDQEAFAVWEKDIRANEIRIRPWNNEDLSRLGLKTSEDLKQYPFDVFTDLTKRINYSKKGVEAHLFNKDTARCVLTIVPSSTNNLRGDFLEKVQKKLTKKVVMHKD